LAQGEKYEHLEYNNIKYLVVLIQYRKFLKGNSNHIKSIQEIVYIRGLKMKLAHTRVRTHKTKTTLKQFIIKISIVVILSLLT